MSAPPPPYQNQPPQQYGYPQQQYGQPQQYGRPQQQYGQPQPPRGPQRHPLRALRNIVIVLAVVGGTAWYVWDYNTNPNGGKAKAEASASAKAKENEKYNPEEGDCVKIEQRNGEPWPVVVDCKSPDAQYKTGERLIGADEQCKSPPYDYSIRVSGRRTVDYTMCFTKV